MERQILRFPDRAGRSAKEGNTKITAQGQRRRRQRAKRKGPSALQACDTIISRANELIGLTGLLLCKQIREALESGGAMDDQLMNLEYVSAMIENKLWEILNSVDVLCPSRAGR